MATKPVADASQQDARAHLQRELIDQWTRSHRAALVRYLQKRARPHVDVEDVVQETFARMAKRDDLHLVDNPQAYLVHAAANVLKDDARRRAARMGSDAASFREEVHGAEERSPERVLIAKQAVAELMNVLAELPFRTRAAFVLHRFEQMSHPEIAQRLGVSVSAVEKHMMKAYAHVLARLGRRP